MIEGGPDLKALTTSVRANSAPIDKGRESTLDSAYLDYSLNITFLYLTLWFNRCNRGFRNYKSQISLDTLNSAFLNIIAIVSYAPLS